VDNERENNRARNLANTIVYFLARCGMSLSTMPMLFDKESEAIEHRLRDGN